jgi:uncharacterized protein (DUF305 family)
LKYVNNERFAGQKRTRLRHTGFEGSSGVSAVRRMVTVAAVLSGLFGLVPAPPARADAPAANPAAGAFEVEFMTMMMNHHLMAVHMGEMCLDKAVHPELLRLCEDIVATQAAEIEQMQGWLAEWYGVDHEAVMDDPAHHQQMEDLAALDGPAFEVAFLDMMVEHHAMAVVDGIQCLRQAQHAELRSLCRRIIASQLREVVQMQAWLCLWYRECDFRNPLAS